MRKSKKLLGLLLSLTLAVTALTGCGVPDEKKEETTPAPTSAGTEDGGDTNTNPTENVASTGKKVYRYSITSEPTSLDPTKGNSVVDNTISYHLGEPLVRNDSGTFIPGTAETWEMSEDGLTYTFKLRDGLVWSDGQPIVAGDYEYGLKRLLDPATASPYAFIGVYIKNGSAVNTGKMDKEELGVKATDDKTLVIELENPTSFFLGLLSMSQYMAVRKDLVEKWGTDFAATAEKNAYSGPFMLVDNSAGKLILEKNPNYWNKDAVKLDRVEITVVQDGNTAFSMYEQGELDYVNIPSLLVPQYDDQDYSYFDGANDYIQINHKANKFTGNKNLRLALSYALNHEEYNMLVNSGVYSNNLRFVLPQVNGANGEYGTEYPYEAYPLKGDKAKAVEYLNKAMEELGIDDPSKITLDLLTTDAESSKKQAEVIQAQFQDTLGIKITITQVAYADRIKRQNSREYELVSAGWAPDYSDPYTYLELFLSTCAYNDSQYENPAYDKLLNDSWKETDPKKRMDMLFEAEKILMEDAAVIGLQFREVHYLLNEKVQNYKTYFVGFNANYVFADIVE